MPGVIRRSRPWPRPHRQGPHGVQVGRQVGMRSDLGATDAAAGRTPRWQGRPRSRCVVGCRPVGQAFEDSSRREAGAAWIVEAGTHSHPLIQRSGRCCAGEPASRCPSRAHARHSHVTESPSEAGSGACRGMISISWSQPSASSRAIRSEGPRCSSGTAGRAHGRGARRIAHPPRDRRRRVRIPFRSWARRFALSRPPTGGGRACSVGDRSPLPPGCGRTRRPSRRARPRSDSRSRSLPSLPRSPPDRENAQARRATRQGKQDVAAAKSPICAGATWAKASSRSAIRRPGRADKGGLRAVWRGKAPRPAGSGGRRASGHDALAAADWPARRPKTAPDVRPVPPG